MIAPPAALAPEDGRLAALVAAFAPDAAERILSRLAGGDLAASWGGSLAGLPRGERLDALARALASSPGADGGEAARALLEAERPGVARALRRLVLEGAPWPGGVHPLLARAARERLSPPPGRDSAGHGLATAPHAAEVRAFPGTAAWHES